MQASHTTKTPRFRWSYDRGTDVLHLTDGRSRRTESIDVGDGLVLHYDAETGGGSGLTITGVHEHLGAASVEQRAGPADTRVLADEFERALRAVAREDADASGAIRAVLRLLDVPRSIRAAEAFVAD